MRTRIADAWRALRLRRKRQRLLFRIWRKRRQIRCTSDRTGLITPDTILAFATVRNELLRLPHFLDYYRNLGVGHFLFVDNDSTDGTAAYLADQDDVSVWHTTHSYKLSRFGMDWLGWLHWRFGHGHWCLTVDADELLVYPQCDTRDLNALTRYLDGQNLSAMGALMLDMYPKGAAQRGRYEQGDNPLAVLPYFDGQGYRHSIHPVFGNHWIQGGVRERVFFTDEPQRAPTLNKTPLVKWHWRNAYVTSTHHMLPPSLNHVFDWPDRALLTGALLHTKFLPDIGIRSQEELGRRQHFENSNLYEAYYQSLITGADLWCERSQAYAGWQQLEALGLISQGKWDA